MSSRHLLFNWWNSWMAASGLVVESRLLVPVFFSSLFLFFAFLSEDQQYRDDYHQLTVVLTFLSVSDDPHPKNWSKYNSRHSTALTDLLVPKNINCAEGYRKEPWNVGELNSHYFIILLHVFATETSLTDYFCHSSLSSLEFTTK